jgi:hypothetical protein
MLPLYSLRRLLAFTEYNKSQEGAEKGAAAGSPPPPANVKAAPADKQSESMENKIKLAKEEQAKEMTEGPQLHP